MKFNGHDFTNLLVVESIERSLMPSIYNRSKTIPDKIGSYFTDSNVGNGQIIVRCRIIKDTRYEVQETVREVAGLLYSKEPRKLELRDEPSLYNMAILSGMSDVGKYLHTGYVELMFECHDPFAYGLLELEKKLNEPFEYRGGHSTPGIIDLLAPSDDLMVISNGNKEIKLIYPFDGTQKVHVDLEKQNITINNNNAMKYLTLDSDFFTISPGKNIITTNGEGVIKYRNRWL